MFKVVILVEVPSKEAAFVECLLEGLQRAGKVSRFKEVTNPSETWEYLARAQIVKMETTMTRDEEALDLLRAAEATFKSGGASEAAIKNVARAVWLIHKRQPLEGVSDETLIGHAFPPRLLAHWGMSLDNAAKKRMAATQALVVARMRRIENV